MDRSERGQLLNVRETRAFPFRGVELREKKTGDGAVLGFEGYACATEQSFEMYDMFGPYTEIVRKGAFAKTLDEGCDTAFLVNHEGVTLARTKPGTLRLAEDDTGLHVDADLDPGAPVVAQLRSAIERKDLDEMSMAFRATRQQWSPDYEQRDILEVNLDKGDVSVVNYGANPYTSAGLRSLRRRHAMGAERYLEALREVRAGKKLSTATTQALQQVLDLISGADDNLDDAQEQLSVVMGVENPDEPEPKAAGFPLELARAMASASRQRRRAS
jgi:HK97 family phage prohead protease